nr:MAG TPA: hypothetical protein [Caudoviricetes sp.]
MEQLKLTDIEDIEYKLHEVKSLMLALEEGIFGNNWNPEMYHLGYAHVWGMVSEIHDDLQIIIKKIQKNRGE